MSTRINTLLLCLICMGFTWPALAQPSGISVRNTLAIRAGQLYHPDNNTHYQMLGFTSLRPYQLLRSRPTHERLRIKYEANLGYARGDHEGVILSANMLAHRYLTEPSTGPRIYIEGGFGLVYTGFQLPGQGLRFNFNPQAGIGMDQIGPNNSRYFISLRISHISNAELHEDNRGMDAVVLSFGKEL